MTKKEKYVLAKWVVNYAVKNGSQEAKASVHESMSDSILVRNKKIDKLQQSTHSGLSLILFVDNKFSTHATNRLDSKKELKHFIKEAIAGTKFLAKDKFRSLPISELYFKKENKTDLKIYDKNYPNIDPQDKIKIVINLEKEVLDNDKRILSVTAGYSDHMSKGVIVTSNGFKENFANTSYNISVSVSVKGIISRPNAFWSESAIFYKKLNTAGIGKTALKRALDKIGQSKINSCQLPMILENRIASNCLAPLISALAAGEIQQNNSFLINKLEKKVCSDKLTLIDDPLIISGTASSQFDDEGLAMKKRIIFDKGILKTYFIDTYYGKKMGMTPNSGNTSNLVVTPGKRSMEDMISDLQKGILVTGFNGGNSNGSTGDFSYGIEGFLIENGKITKPVSEMNITGNMLELWQNLVEVGNDVYSDSSWRLPSLKFDNLDFSGI